MTKLLLAPVLLLAGCVFTGLYGALHNQLSYTVSPDYFHHFKFRQFRIPERRRDRLGASLVGWYGAWWMGLVIGAPLVGIGLLLPDAETCLRECALAYALVGGTAMLAGVAALGYGRWFITEATLPWYWQPVGVADRVAFARARALHNASYVGGLVGVGVGAVYLLAVWCRLAAA